MYIKLVKEKNDLTNVHNESKDEYYLTVKGYGDKQSYLNNSDNFICQIPFEIPENIDELIESIKFAIEFLYSKVER